MAQLYTFHLFAGAGGGILADALLGHCPVGAVEIEPYPRGVLLQRQRDGALPPFPVWDDVRTFRADNPECAEFIEGLRAIADRLIICGGFPCPKWSSARRGAGDPPDLWPEMLRIVAEVAPVAVFAENVAREPIERAAIALRAIGYRCRCVRLAASGVGAGHLRERWWLRGDADEGREPGRLEHAETPRVPQADGLDWWRDDHPSRVGVPDGLAHRLDRLRAAGNGQASAVAALAWQVLGG
jgi:DNA (cytosine-5)-methyltransferase 1